MTASNDRWNPFRLLETLAFFGEIPLIGNIRWIQQMLGTASNPTAPPPESLVLPLAVLLLTAPETRSESLRQRLSQQGWELRSLPLPSHDTDAATIAPLRVINAAALVWIGVPGDEACLAAAISTLAASKASEAVSLFDFQGETVPPLRDLWGAVDDGVMGGVSTSSMTILPNFARFAGQVSTANSGGFASVRTLNFEPPFNLSQWQGIRLTLRGDGQRYKVILRNSGNWDSLAYCASVDTEPDTWIDVDVPFAALRPTFRAKTQSTAPPLNPAGVCSFQLMLSKFEYDGKLNPHFQPGPFSLDMRSLAVYRMVALPRCLAIAATPEQATAYRQQFASQGMSYEVLEQGDQAWIEHCLKIVQPMLHA